MNTVIRALEYWVASPLAHALGWTLVHFLWQGAAVAALLAAALWAADARSARLRYGLAAGALALLPLAFVLTFAALAPANRGAGAVAAQLYPLEGLAPGAFSRPVRPSLIDPLSWLAPLWLAGVLACYARSLAGWIAVARLRRRGVCAAPDAWQQRLRDLSAELKLSRPVRLLESCLTEVPVVVGVLRPVILAPLGLLSGLSPDQVEAILIHELAHIRRWDYAVNLAQNLVEGLLFYHPAVWWISRVVRAERENCCDDVAVALRPDARAYAAALARLETNRHPAAGTALAASGGNLMNRIRRLLLPPPPRHRGAAPVLSIVLLITAVAMAAAWAQQPPARPAPGPYAKWVSEDVAYIITDQERAAFKSLPTDAEREHFIEQFWLRRDPTPGTPANEYKEEHYRRIAYASEHFSFMDLPGWKADRGKIYIMYGPPDEIEDHPPEARRAAYQEWRYRFIEGMGDNVIVHFDDPDRNGEYRISMDPNPKPADPFLLAGDQQLRAGALDAAISEYVRGMAADPGSPVVYQKRIIEVLMRLGQRDKAAAINQQILNANPQDSDAQGLDGYLRLEKGDIAGATAELLAAVGAKPRNAVLHFDLGLSWLAAGKSAQARQELETAVDLRPDYMEARLEVAKLDARTAQAGAIPKEFTSDGNPRIVVQVYPNRQVVTLAAWARPADQIRIALTGPNAPTIFEDRVSGRGYQRTDTLPPGTYTLQVQSPGGNQVTFTVE